MDLKSFEKIINEAWKSKNQVSSKSNKKLLKTFNQTIEFEGFYPEVTTWVGSAFVIGGIIAAIMHFWQWSQFVSKKGAQS